MMTVSKVEGVRIVTFKCGSCRLSRFPCISCQQDKSVYNLGYLDGSLGNEENFIGFNGQQVQIYRQGYNHGKEDFIKK